MDKCKHYIERTSTLVLLAKVAAMVYMFAYIAVLTCLSGLNSADVLNWKGCNFTKMTVTAASTELTRRLTPLLDKTYVLYYFRS